jgi:predicted GNAT superfamily acetyltransferase
MLPNVTVKTIENNTELQQARHIFDKTWSKDNGTEVTANLLKAMVHSGSYLAGAFLSGNCIGASFAFPAKPTSLRLHSHMTAVSTQYMNLGIGFALKSHQKIWARNNGYSEITWTFDPLISKNANFNLVKLGADVESYLPNFYGEMLDSINLTDESDRLMACWKILENNSQVKRIIESPDLSDLLIKIPDDIMTLRINSIKESLEIRLNVRRQFLEAIDLGYKIVGFSKTNEYILRKTSQI